MTKKGNRPSEPRITNPATHPNEWVCLSVAAEFCGMDRRALNCYIDLGKLTWEWHGRMRKIHIDEVARFRAWHKSRARLAS